MAYFLYTKVCCNGSMPLFNLKFEAPVHTLFPAFCHCAFIAVVDRAGYHEYKSSNSIDQLNFSSH